MPKKEKTKRKDFEKREKVDNEAADKEVTEYIEQMQRIQAEFENYKKRTEKEKQELVTYGKATLIKQLLSVVDSFEMALKNINNPEDETLKGILMVHRQLISLLEAEGVKPIDAKGKSLDPYMHEVLMQKESEEEEGRIIEELQKGYMLKDKVIRTSKVCVSKNTGGK